MPHKAAMLRNTRFGIPGTIPSSPRMPLVTASARGWPRSCDTICWLMSCGRETRVTRMATATDNSSAGICATSPSPIVSSA